MQLLMAGHACLKWTWRPTRCSWKKRGPIQRPSERSSIATSLKSSDMQFAGRRELGRDLAAETFLLAFRHLWRFRWSGISLSSWLLGTQLNGGADFGQPICKCAFTGSKRRAASESDVFPEPRSNAGIEACVALEDASIAGNDDGERQAAAESPVKRAVRVNQSRQIDPS